MENEDRNTNEGMLKNWHNKTPVNETSGNCHYVTMYKEWWLEEKQNVPINEVLLYICSEVGHFPFSNDELLNFFWID